MTGRRWRTTVAAALAALLLTLSGCATRLPPTEPLAPGQRVEIDRDDRIYVGAWTRLVIRQATASEKAGQG